MWFLDARTLEVRFKFTGDGEARGLMWGYGLFTLDSKRFVASDGLNNVMVWDLVGRKVTRKVPIGTSEMMLKLSPDGRYCAFARQDAGQGVHREDAGRVKCVMHACA